MIYNRCGHSGLLLPAISLGLWHNFSESDDFDRSRAIIRTAFDHGITHFDLADNYGPPPGSAECTMGRLMAGDMAHLRDQMVITTKAGHQMWPGPYGDWGSRKHLIAACDQSLRRMGLDYVDIFYSHRPDPDTPLEETMQALDHLVRSGRALYIGLSKYPAPLARQALGILRGMGTPCIVQQMKYSMLVREPEAELLPTLRDEGIGAVSFSPLAQGQLSERYLDGIPSDSRAAHEGFLTSNEVSRNIERVRALHTIAQQRGQSLSQMAISWQLNRGITSVVVGVSSTAQLLQNMAAIDTTTFTTEELAQIDRLTL